MGNIIDIQSHFHKSEYKYFLDTNIWLSIYGPLTYHRKRANIYSAAFRDFRQMTCAIFIDVVVLSEFINAYARWEFDQSAFGSMMKFKEFRKRPEFKKIAEDIAQRSANILSQCNRCESGFTVSDIDTIISDFGKGDYDFNDQIIWQTCENNGFTLVTDDSDIAVNRVTSFKILTANQDLLK